MEKKSEQKVLSYMSCNMCYFQTVKHNWCQYLLRLLRFIYMINHNILFIAEYSVTLYTSGHNLIFQLFAVSDTHKTCFDSCSMFFIHFSNIFLAWPFVSLCIPIFSDPESRAGVPVYRYNVLLCQGETAYSMTRHLILYLAHYTIFDIE